MVDVKLSDLEHRSDASEFLQLSKMEYGADADVSKLTYFIHKFLRNPAGITKSLGLENSGVNIGRLALLPRKLFLGQKKIASVYPTEFLVQKEQRDFEKLVKLIKIFKSQTEAESFIFVTPNKNSLNIWRKLSGLKNELPLKVKVIPLMPLKLLCGQKYRKTKFIFCRPVELLVRYLFFSVSWFCDCLSPYRCLPVALGDRCSVDLIEFFNENELRGDRSQRSLLWRTSFRPSNEYQFVEILKDKHVVGYGIYSLPQNYDGLKPVVLLDVVARPEHRSAVFRCLGRSAVLRNKQADLVLFIGIAPFLNSSFHTMLPFINVPNRFIPDANSVLFHGVSDELINAEFYLTLFDFDMF
jgi:hypothetical protein